MIKSRLYWRVLANFALLLVILTAMTMLTLNILSQIEKNFTLAKADSKSLNDIEMARQYLNEVTAAANEYAFTSTPRSKTNYIASWKELEFALSPLSDDFNDSASVRDVRQIRSLYAGWMQFVGDKLILIGDMPRTPENASAIQDSVQKVMQTELQIRYLATARRLLHDLYAQKISSLPQNISTATIQSSDLRKFITLVNVLLAVFALALGFVLTRSITIPVRLLKQGTQNIMAGIFEPIVLR
jgi:hypothetical protein